MFILIPFLSLLLSLLLGVIIAERLSFKPRNFEWFAFVIPLGLIMFTLVNYLSCLIFSFPKGILIAQTILALSELIYLIRHKYLLKKTLFYFKSFLFEKYLIILSSILGLILVALFHTHIILNHGGDLYTGDSTYGDLPFHLSTISNIAYAQRFPPDNPFYANTKLVYPYLINFFSAILVYEGWSLRNSIIIPSLLLSISLISLIYGFTFGILKDKIKSALTVVLYFLNGGLGFYFFLKDYSFNLSAILYSLSNPQFLKEYSHMWEQNIQWVNFLSRIVVPERSLLFGIPAGIIILRLLFFRKEKRSLFDLILVALLLSLMPLLHTHTFLTMLIILPILSLWQLKQSKAKDLKDFLIVAFLTVLFSSLQLLPFISHLQESGHFMILHLGWMQKSNESFWEFWFKNTYLMIPLSLLTLFISRVVNMQIRILQICSLTLFVLMNLILFSPYDWDNVKFLYWIWLFLVTGVSSLFVEIFKRKNIFLNTLIIITVFTMISSASLSLLREINVRYILFSKEAVNLGEKVRLTIPNGSIFLTYKIHNSPVNNLAGRSILMGYSGLLWVHGINYQERDKDINDIYNGSNRSKQLLQKYGVDYAVVESYDPKGMFINRPFFEQYPIILKSENYTIYKINE